MYAQFTVLHQATQKQGKALELDWSTHLSTML